MTDSVWAFNQRIAEHKRRIQRERREKDGNVSWKRDLSFIPQAIINKVKNDGKQISNNLLEKLRRNHQHINWRGISTSSNKKKHRKQENTIPLIYWC